MFRTIIVIIALSLIRTGFGQLGGQSLFQFLNAPQTAKVAALGGTVVSGQGKLPAMVVYNPSLLNPDMHNNLQVSEVFYAPGVKYSSGNYVGKNKNGKLWAAGVNNLSFQEMIRRDASGANQGTFFANQTVLYYGRARKTGNFTLGYNLKYAQSWIERYFAAGLYGDVGVSFDHPEKELSFGLVARNIGAKIKNYAGAGEAIPFQIQSGVTFKPEHMPLRMTVSLHNLQQFDIVYNDPDQDDGNLFDDDEEPHQPSIGEKIMRHVSLGGELILSRNVHLRFGYTYMRRRELRLNRSGGAGINWGFMVRIKDFDCEFGKSYWQYAGRPTFISITTNLNRFKKKKVVINEQRN